MRRIIQYLLAAIMLLFGLLTLFLSTSIVFDWFDIRIKEGNYVLFVVWANLISSIIYLISAYGLVKLKKWTFKLLSLSVLILIIAFICLLIYIYSGGIYETKTIAAMIFRTSLTLLFAVGAYYIVPKKSVIKNN